MQDILSAMEMAKQSNNGNFVNSLVGGMQTGQKIGEILKNSGLFGGSAAGATQGATAAASAVPPVPPVV